MNLTLIIKKVMKEKKERDKTNLKTISRMKIITDSIYKKFKALVSPK